MIEDEFEEILGETGKVGIVKNGRVSWDGHV